MPPLSLAISAPPTSVWIATVASYLLGAIPFGLCLGLWLKRVDIRQEGSKNIGATNAMRILGKPLGITAFVLDLAKGDVMFAATGVTSGTMLRGVRRFPGGATTHSIIMRSKTGTVRTIEAHHDWTRKPIASDLKE